ncbi:3-oxoacyl-[acyl-carrier-protein] synthase, KASIII [hydrothermal vent metagenome]|uniref:beta-ketoacyl-[acyl-carrier-protein] synthase III n=1 Tax=hydrothermal vent metagenome TaxID=652676 RepID=A0A3B1BL26_9ZZZZ
MTAAAHSIISGLGRNVPDKVLSNADLEKMVDTSDEWIKTRTGISERRIADDGVTTSQLGIPSAREALKNAGVSPKELDLLLCATSTPENMFPSTACSIGHGIGAGDCPSFDLLAACTGFIYAVSVADNFIRSGSANNVLIVASEIYSRIVNWKDRGTCVLFGDGAAAVVVSRSDVSSGIIDSIIHSNGAYGDLLTVGGVASRRPVAGRAIEDAGYFLKMKGNQTFKVAVKRMTDVASKLLEKNGLTAGDVDMVIPHQANIRIINAVGKSLGVPEEKVFVNVNKYGNTSAASIPIAMYEAVEEGRVKPGDLVLLVAFGGGLTWGATLIRW